MDKQLVTDYEELFLAYKKRVPEFIITGDLIEEMKDVKRGQLSDVARLGTELASRGGLQVFEVLYNKIRRLFKGSDTSEQRLKDNLSIIYHILINEDGNLYFRLKSLDY